jgi:chromosomal replication initiator protein
MITDIQLPDQPTRQAILEAKCQERKYVIPDSALSFIASHIETNIRELEGALNTVIAYLQSNGLEPTTEHVRAALRKFSTKDVSVKKGKSDLLIELVAGHFSISTEDLIGPCRQKELVHPRQLLMYLLKHEAGMTLPMIGREIGGRDHTTIMYGISKVTNDLKRNPSVLQDLQELKELFYDYR